jgi:hypothetical protein
MKNLKTYLIRFIIVVVIYLIALSTIDGEKRKNIINDKLKPINPDFSCFVIIK